ncbi:mechanosensitive ion channel domain-containing protein [Thetidibacter halocola]|uniref:Mechanosensitive ion channel n=1 Tax=Thetidibacter halocola TaxID=2827239 RepID=A0A8J7W9V4_9RHOB|nr:mechanosensitive ion channel domain-containing protein [Thetidibacter halocola]MBS0123575.1 mechanosensitive ion channel [Thetidibacter halocola]
MTLLSRLAAAFLVVLMMGLSGPGSAQTMQSPPAETVSQDAAVQALLDVLNDPAAREALIARLQATETAAPEPEPETPPTFAERLATATSGAAGLAIDEIGRLFQLMTNLNGLAEVVQLAGVDRAALLDLLMTIAATLGAYVVLGGVGRSLGRRWRQPRASGLAATLWPLAGLTAIRLVVVIFSWAIGYLVSSTLFSDGSGPSRAQGLYLNAFAGFGLFRVVLRAIFTPDAEHEPGLSDAAPRAQERIYQELRLLGGLTIQTTLFIVPLVQLWIGFVEARSVRVILATVTALLAMRAIQAIRHVLRASRGHRGTGTGDTAGDRVARGAQTLWLGVWPPLAMLYVGFAWFIALTRPLALTDTILGGTAFTLLGLGLMFVAARLVHMAGKAKSPLAGWFGGLVPQLGSRAANIVASVVWGVAVALFLAAFGTILHGWGIVDMTAVMAREGVQTVLWGLISAALVVLLAAIVWAVVASWIDYQLAATLTGADSSARRRTLLALFRSGFAIVLITMTVMVVLSQLGINIGPLIAGAGVVGLAVGFGAQKLVQDVITGIFIQVENAMNEGDVVGVAGITGSVEKISIRSVRLRTIDGAAHVIPFSSVDLVSNMTRDFGYHVAEIGAAYKENVETVKAAMFEAFDRVKEEYGNDILEPLEMHGVTMLGDSAVVVRARIKTRAGKQWGIGRTYTQRVKEVMDERGIEIPFPHRQLIISQPEAKPLLEPPKPAGA